MANRRQFRCSLIIYNLLIGMLFFLISPLSHADEYSEPTYSYRWAGWSPAELANAYWDSPQLLRAGIQSYIDNHGYDELLGSMEQSLPMWTVVAWRNRRRRNIRYLP